MLNLNAEKLLLKGFASLWPRSNGLWPVKAQARSFLNLRRRSMLLVLRRAGIFLSLSHSHEDDDALKVASGRNFADAMGLWSRDV